MDPSQFATAARYCGILAVILGIATVILWVRGIKWRFAFFGYTSFTALLAFGLAALSLGPIIRTTIPGAAAYTTVFDNGSTRAAIAVDGGISPETLALTLEQASQNLYSAGRYASTSNILTIRARTVVHPESGISKPLYLGQVQRSLLVRDDPNQDLSLDFDAFAELRQYVPEAIEEDL